MSDDQPPEHGSRRRRREIREARERAARQRRAEESPPSHPAAGESDGGAPASPETSSRDDDGPVLFDGQAAEHHSESSADGASTEPLAQSAETPAEAPIGMAAAGAPSPAPAGTGSLDAALSPERAEPEHDPASGPESGTESETEADDSATSGGGRGSSDEPQAPGSSETPLDARLLGAGEHIEHDAEGTPVLISSSDYGRGYQTVTPLAGTPGRRILDKRRQRRRRRNITLASVLAGLVVLMVVLAVVFRTVFGGIFSEPEDYEAVSGGPVTFTVERGDGWSSVAHDLASEGIIASAEAFDQALQDVDEVGTLQVGEYAMNEQMPAEDALGVLSAEQESRLYVALDAGTRLDDAYAEIAEATEYSAGELRDAAADPTEFGLPGQAESLEGYLAAGEHQFPVDATATEILQQMVDETLGWLEDAGVTDPAEQYEVVTKASLLTAEAQPDDYRTVAGIIENRLQPDNTETDGFLQIDSTANYGLEQRDLNLSREQLDDPENEYSTHAHRGLPPGPIEAVTQEAIEAATDPADNDYYYWVTTNIATGETKFAETYAEHQQYVDEYDAYCEENPDVCGDGDAPNTETHSE
ncbi:endolytic transglycosylase MltG [Nesterenkonia sp. F]|uniref:endolytic transglycosylase MltG n=1 Tax=Nesterenkonia sp. F TaxID=795955 RepID=UPI000255D590|nr:endolytic transglycosylase MltG [Nesterenkonia sp. F]